MTKFCLNLILEHMTSSSMNKCKCSMVASWLKTSRIIGLLNSRIHTLVLFQHLFILLGNKCRRLALPMDWIDRLIQVEYHPFSTLVPLRPLDFLLHNLHWEGMKSRIVMTNRYWYLRLRTRWGLARRRLRLRMHSKHCSRLGSLLG